MDQEDRAQESSLKVEKQRVRVVQGQLKAEVKLES